MSEKIIQTPIRESIREYKMNYSFNINLFRSFPNVYDGLKVVQRRISYTAKELGLSYKGKYTKSAKVVGDCLGKYHPHGDMAVYDAMVKMAQDFFLNYPIIDGYGNFGSVQGDSAAAQRYTESRMTKYGYAMFDNIDKNAVHWVDNYLGDDKEPVTLPVKYPNLLINGSFGIGQAYVSSIPPHNFSEIIDVTKDLMNDPSIPLEDIASRVKPDYPTGGSIINEEELKEAYMTGYGNIRIRGKMIHDDNKKTLTIVSIPYMNNLGKIKDEILKQVKAENITGLSDVKDESNKKNGIKLVLSAKKGFSLTKLEEQIYKYTSLQDTLLLSLIATEDDVDFKMYNIKSLLLKWINYRRDTLKRIFNHEMVRIKKRSHILEGLLKAILDIDTIIAEIKKSDSKKQSIENLMKLKQFNFTELQARYIAEMELYKVSALTSKSGMEEELEELNKELAYYLNLFTNKEALDQYIINELDEGKKMFSRERKTDFISVEELDESNIEDKQYTLFITKANMIKKVELELSTQNRAGKGRSNGGMKKNDYIIFSDVVNSKDNLMLFTNKGRVYVNKVYDIESCKVSSQGLALKNILTLSDDEKVVAAISVSNDDLNSENNLLFVTKNGLVKRTSIDHYDSIRKSGIIALKLNENDSLIKVTLNKNEEEELILATKKGKVARFEVGDIPLTLRDTMGVKGLDLSEDDEVIGAEINREDVYFISVVTQNGKGKKVLIDEITKTQRGVKGMMLAKLRSDDEIASICLVNVDSEITYITKNKMIKLVAKDVNSMLRPAMGVTLIKLDEDDIVIDTFVE